MLLLVFSLIISIKSTRNFVRFKEFLIVPVCELINYSELVGIILNDVSYYEMIH